MLVSIEPEGRNESPILFLVEEDMVVERGELGG